MSLEAKLAKLTAKGPSLEGGLGGEPEFTREDVCAALGYANGKIPRDQDAVHLVLAKHCGDPISLAHLVERMPDLAWDMYRELSSDEEVRYTAVRKMARLAILEFCEAAALQGVTTHELAMTVGVSTRKWMPRYRPVYTALLGHMYRLEGAVLPEITKAIG